VTHAEGPAPYTSQIPWTGFRNHFHFTLQPSANYHAYIELQFCNVLDIQTQYSVGYCAIEKINMLIDW